MQKSIDTVAKRFVENVSYVEDAYLRVGGAVLECNEVSERFQDSVFPQFHPPLVRAQGRLLAESLRLTGVSLVLFPCIILDRRLILASQVGERFEDSPYDAAEAILADTP